MGSDLRRTVIIENVAPTVDGGRYAVKREVGDVVDVEADIFKEGHDVIVAVLKYRRAREAAWREAPMSFVDNDRWRGRFTLDAVDRWQFTIEAMADPFRSWLVDLAKRVEAGQDVARELLEGAGLVRAAADRASGNDAMALRDYAGRLARGDRPADAVATAREERLGALMRRHLDRSDATSAEREFDVVADPERARYAAWYEFFPRSGVPGRHATFKDRKSVV